MEKKGKEKRKTKIKVEDKLNNLFLGIMALLNNDGKKIPSKNI
jgi:hypothetical protein